MIIFPFIYCPNFLHCIYVLSNGKIYSSMVWKRNKSVTLVNRVLASMPDGSKLRGWLMDLSLCPPFSSTEKLVTRGNHLTVQASILHEKEQTLLKGGCTLSPRPPCGLPLPSHLRGTLASVYLLEAGICPDSVLCFFSLSPCLGCHRPATHNSPTLSSTLSRPPEHQTWISRGWPGSPHPASSKPNSWSFPSKPGEFPNSLSHDRTNIHLLGPPGDTWILLGPNAITSEMVTSSLPLF